MTCTISKGEFIDRFVVHMVKCVGPRFDDGGSVEDYAREVAPSYYENHHRDDPTETPEVLADLDMSYWGED